MRITARLQLKAFLKQSNTNGYIDLSLYHMVNYTIL
jgi:hypothetical protein